jgi:hypothetical protein
MDMRIRNNFVPALRDQTTTYTLAARASFAADRRFIA